jgi:hypothetical protein
MTLACTPGVCADPAAAPATQAPQLPAAAATDVDTPALDRLFRHSLRAGRQHPLQDLLRRYRAGERS